MADKPSTAARAFPGGGAQPGGVRITTVPGPGKPPLLVESLAPTSPGSGQVMVRMGAAALNFADLLMVEGRYQETPPYPFIPGLEGAGEVIAVGEGCSLKPGQRVAVSAQGTLAEIAVFPENTITPLPEGMGWNEAAGFQIAYGTSHLALTDRAHLAAGETLAVLGAGGGVGLTAVEVGAALGARVIAIARGAEKSAAAMAAGAAEVLSPDDPVRLKDALRAAGGVDVVYDPVGAAPGLAAFGALRPGGRFIVIGFAGGTPPALPLNHALVKNIAIHGFYWGGYRRLDPALLRRSMEALFGLWAEGRLHPHVGHVLPLDRLAEGYALLRDRRSVGKVVITL